MKSDKVKQKARFTHYLRPDEHLIWVSEPLQNGLIGNSLAWIMRGFVLILAAVALLNGIGFMSVAATTIVSSYLIMIAASTTYYALSTDRVLILHNRWFRRLYEVRLELLPEHVERRQTKSSTTLRFQPNFKSRQINTDSIIPVHVYQPGLKDEFKRLEPEEADQAYQLILAVKDGLLEDRAKELGLM